MGTVDYEFKGGPFDGFRIPQDENHLGPKRKYARFDGRNPRKLRLMLLEKEGSREAVAAERGIDPREVFIYERGEGHVYKLVEEA